MPLVNFSKFIDQVEDGRKTCTIRATRVHPFKEGDDLHLYTGARTKAVRRLLPAPVECREAWDFDMSWFLSGHPMVSLKMDGAEITFADLATFQRLAKLDGFACGADMTDYFLPKGREKFVGQLIRWKHPDRPFVPTFDALFR